MGRKTMNNPAYERIKQFIFTYTNVGRNSDELTRDEKEINKVTHLLVNAETMRDMAELWAQWCVEDAKRHAWSRQQDMGWLAKKALALVVERQIKTFRDKKRSDLLISLFGTGHETTFEDQINSISVEQKVALLLIGCQFPNVCRPAIMAYFGLVNSGVDVPDIDNFFKDFYIQISIRAYQGRVLRNKTA